jgi:hypothetical protein
VVHRTDVVNEEVPRDVVNTLIYNYASSNYKPCSWNQLGEKFFKNQKKVLSSNFVITLLWSWFINSTSVWKAQIFICHFCDLFSVFYAFLLRHRQHIPVSSHDVLLTHRPGKNRGLVHLDFRKTAQVSYFHWSSEKYPVTFANCNLRACHFQIERFL